MRTYKVVFAIAFVSAVVLGCGDSEPEGMWKATVYMSQGSKGEVIGEYMTRDECQHAGVMHIAADKKEAHKHMNSKKMSVGCSFVPSI